MSIQRIRLLWRAFRSTLRQLIGTDLPHRIQVQCERITLGQSGCDWCVCPNRIHPGDIVYSFGIGHDISFDTALIERFNVPIHAFDPTPRAIAWARTQTLPPKFQLHEWGLAHFDGELEFHPPTNPKHVSYSAVHQKLPWQTPFKGKVYRLRTILRMLGHSRIDILKMDVEGLEYDIIDDILMSDIPIGQFLIEFHHGRTPHSLARTRRTIEKLNSKNFRVFNISQSGQEYSFLYD